MKRIVVIIVTLSLLVTMFIIPVAATEVETSAYQPQFIDLLSYGTVFDFYITKSSGKNLSSTGHEPISPMFGGSSILNVSFVWGNTVDKIYYDYVYACIEIGARPDSVSFFNTVGTLVGSSDNLYFYKFNVSGNYWANFEFFIDPAAGYIGSCNIQSAYGIVDSTQFISSVNYRMYGELHTEGQFYFQEFSNVVDKEVPFTYEKTFESANPGIAPAYTYYEVTVPLSVVYADSLSMTFSSPNIFPNDYDDSLLNSSGAVLMVDGKTLETLDVVTSKCVASSNYWGRPIYIQTATVDLRGLNLANGSIVFRFYMNSRTAGYYDPYNEVTFYRFQLLNLGLKLDTYEKPWYVRFFYWIQDEFTSLKQTIRESFGVGQDTSDIQDKTDSVIEDQQQNNDAVDDIIDELEQAPTLPDFDDTGLGEFSSDVQSDIAPVQNIFVVIFEEPLIFQMISYVFMFALGGFLLFGER